MNPLTNLPPEEQQRVIVTLEALARAKKARAEKGARNGSFPCPCCHTKQFHWAAAANGHLRGCCRDQTCISFLE